MKKETIKINVSRAKEAVQVITTAVLLETYDLPENIKDPEVLGKFLSKIGITKDVVKVYPGMVAGGDWEYSFFVDLIDTTEFREKLKAADDIKEEMDKVRRGSDRKRKLLYDYFDALANLQYPSQEMPKSLQDELQKRIKALPHS